jgi:TrpR-related protein YerC/YecD
MPYRSKFASKDINKLFETILQLNSVGECYRFFEDVCTIKEVQDMAQRLKVAHMLEEKHSYQDIVNETKASTATISRVAKSLTYGAEGYHLVFKRIEKSKK